MPSSPPSRPTLLPSSSSTTTTTTTARDLQAHGRASGARPPQPKNKDRDARRHSHLTRSVTQKENLHLHPSAASTARRLERAALGISTRSRAKQLGIFLDDAVSIGADKPKRLSGKTLDAGTRTRRPLEDRTMSQTANTNANAAPPRPRSAMPLKRKAGVMLDPTDTSPRVAKTAFGGMKRSMVQTKLSFSSRSADDAESGHSNALFGAEDARKTSDLALAGSLAVPTMDLGMASLEPSLQGLQSAMQGHGHGTESTEQVDEDEEDEPISSRFALRPPTPPRPHARMDNASTTPSQSPSHTTSMSILAKEAPVPLPLTPPPSQPTEAPAADRTATPTMARSAVQAPTSTVRPPFFFARKTLAASAFIPQAPPATPRAAVPPTPGRALSTSRFRMYTPGTIRKPTGQTQAAQSPRAPEKQALLQGLVRQPDVPVVEEATEETMDLDLAHVSSAATRDVESLGPETAVPIEQASGPTSTPPKVEMPRLDRLSLSPEKRLATRTSFPVKSESSAPIRQVPHTHVESVGPGPQVQEELPSFPGHVSPSSAPKETLAAPASAIVGPPAPAQTPAALPKPSAASSLPLRRPVSRPIMTTATDPLPRLTPASAPDTSDRTGKEDAQSEPAVRRKPSYPSSLSLGAGPQARTTARVVSQVHIPSSRSVTQPASLFSKPAAGRDPIAPSTTFKIVSASPRPSVRSVSAPVPREPAARGAASSEITESLSGLSAALQKLKERPRSMLGPSASAPAPAQPRANLSASVSFAPPAKPSASTLSASVAARPAVGLTRTPLTADVSSSSVNPNTSLSSSTTSHALAALVSSSSTSRCLKGVVAYVDVQTADGADSSPLFADMLRSLGARVLSRPTENCTHIVYKSGKPGTITWWYRQEEPRPHIVGISWVTKSKEKGARQGEEAYAVKVDEESVWGKRRKSMEPKKLLSAMGQGAGMGAGAGVGAVGKKGSFLDPNAALLQAKRNSLLYTPKVGSPLKKVAVRRESDQNAAAQ